MISANISNAIIFVIGWLYTSYCSHKALRYGNEYQKTIWLSYWIVNAALFLIEDTMENLLHLPNLFSFYYDAKTILAISIIPLQKLEYATSSTSLYIYEGLVCPCIREKESCLDAALTRLQIEISNPIEAFARFIACTKKLLITMEANFHITEKLHVLKNYLIDLWSQNQNVIGKQFKNTFLGIDSNKSRDPPITELNRTESPNQAKHDSEKLSTSSDVESKEMNVTENLSLNEECSAMKEQNLTSCTGLLNTNQQFW